MARLSVTVITANEEDNIAACLESVRWAEDIVVLDSGSTDRTVEIARRYTDRVLTAPWEGFSRNKNLALEYAREPWVFSLDADERVTAELGEEIRGVVAADGPADGYRVARRNYFCGRWIRHLGWWPDYSVRLFRRGKGRFTDREVHESVAVDGRVDALRHPLEHYTYRSLSDFVGRMDRYSQLAARELDKRGRRLRWGELLWRPWFTFLNLYLLKRGFLEGQAGFTLAALYSMYNFLKYAKLAEIQRNKNMGGERR